MFRRRNKRNLRYLLLLIVFGMTVFIRVGYAYLMEQLNINGTATVSKQTWNVHFDGESIDDSGSQLSSCVNENQCSKVTSQAAVAQDNVTINFGVIFHVVGDYYQFTVDVVNDGTVDAMLVDVVKTGITQDNSSYLDFKVTYSDGSAITANDFLEKCGGKETIKVTVTAIGSPTSDVTANLGVQINYEQANPEQAKDRAVDPWTKIASLNTEGESISTTDHANELRFIGKYPNNYVKFNGGNQTWRIIGIFNGKLKLIQETPIGNYSWDTSKETVNRGYGVNQWGASTLTDGTTYTGADLMKLLNPGYEANSDLRCISGSTYDSSNGIVNCGDNSASNYDTIAVNNSLYWNATSGKCYTYGNYNAADCNFTSTGLSDTVSKAMIDDATWYLGSLDTPSANIWDGRITASVLYNWERSSASGKQCSNATYCSDTVNRTTTWTGKVGLMYPSDYVYATGGGSVGRAECLVKTSSYVSDSSIQNWSNTFTDCYKDDWLYYGSWQWSLSPRAHSSYSYPVFNVTSAGYVDSTGALGAGAVRPVVYLKSSVSFTSKGNGTQSNPFQLKDTSS